MKWPFSTELWLRVKYSMDLQTFRKKALMDPEDLHYQVLIGEVLDKLGRSKEALEVYRRASWQYAQNGLLGRAVGLNQIVKSLEEKIGREKTGFPKEL